jgi:penicillin-binding protein 2
MSAFTSWEVGRRALVARVVLVLAFLLLAGAFFRAQVLQSDAYRVDSERARLRPLALAAPRGRIVDRNGELIAENLPGYAVRLHATREDSLRAELQRLDSLLVDHDIDHDAVVERWRQARFVPALVVGDGDFALVSRLEEHRAALPGLLIQVEPRRAYPGGEALGHLVGYVGEVSRADLDADRFPGARMGEVVGRFGLEIEYDSVLRGTPGVRYVEVTARGRTVRAPGEHRELMPEAGRDLVTTIDLPLQRFVDSMWRNTPYLATRPGALLAMRPDGAILAYYSYPTFDPNIWVGGISREDYAVLRDDPARPLVNRVIYGRYPPASPFKLAVAAMGLKRGLVTMSSRMPVPCSGGLQFGNRRFRCWKAEGHGSLDLTGAIATSCDVYFYQLGQRLGADALMEDGTAFGFGDRSGIDLELEQRPIFPEGVRSYVDRRGNSTWNRGEVLNLSIGQGANAQTLVNMVSFYAALASDGVKRAPYLVERRPGVPDRDLGLTPEHLAGLRQAMSDVVTRGTAGASGGRDLMVAGKTGTGQQTGKEDLAWFLAFAPLDNPEIVVGIIVDEGLHGSTSAVHAVRTIRRFLLGPDSAAIRAPVDLPITEELRPPDSTGRAIGTTP